MIKHLRGLRNEARKVDVGLILLRERRRGGLGVGARVVRCCAVG